MRPIEFWFDFSSGYAYFASHTIDAVGARHGRPVVWRPFMLGVAFKATGARGLSGTPIKGDYARHDWARLARLMNVPFQLPPNHPIVALPASRAFYWIERRDPNAAVAFAKSVFRAYYGDNLDMTSPDVVADLAASVGVERSAILDGMSSPDIKEHFKSITEAAVAKGVFGSPFLIVDGEPFWGSDRLAMMDLWLERGGW